MNSPKRIAGAYKLVRADVVRVLPEAFAWACEVRSDANTGDDIWNLRRDWTRCSESIARDLAAGRYPDKTSIGPLARGFYFLGYHHTPTGLRLADKTLANHRAKLTRLYEQCRRSAMPFAATKIALNNIYQAV